MDNGEQVVTKSSKFLAENAHQHFPFPEQSQGGKPAPTGNRKWMEWAVDLTQSWVAGSFGGEQISNFLGPIPH